MEVYSTATQQFWITNYKAIMAKYDYLSCVKFTAFIKHLLPQQRKQFQAVIAEEQLLARTSLQEADAVAHFISSVVFMHRASWLQLSSFPREVQSTVEDLPFDGLKLFLETTDESLRTLKDSRATMISRNLHPYK